MAADYGSKDFWEERYTNGPDHFRAVFDWFPTTSDQDPVIAALQSAHVPKNGRVLDIGCGNSVLCAQIWEHGYSRVIGIDFSTTVVERMAASRPAEAHGLHYMLMDASTLSFSDESLDAVVDKGLLDAILAASDRHKLWQTKVLAGGNPKKTPQGLMGDEAAKRSLEKGLEVLREIHRVLRPGAVYVCVSYEGPTLREPLLKHGPLKWDVKRCIFCEDKDQHMYVCSKPLL